MSGKRAAWATAMAAAAMLAGTACGNSVTVSETGGGGADASSSSGGSSSVGDIGAAGGANPTGGASQGGANPTGGASMVGGAGGALPTGGAGGAGGSATCPGLGEPCTDCMSDQCADVWCTCVDEIHCGGYLQCLGTCMMGDTACFQNCAAVHQDGISAGILVADCASTTCDASCNFGKPLTGCQKCLYTDCSKDMNACIADPECLALIQCLQACAPGDMVCGQMCVMQHQDGLPEAQAVGDCSKASCSDVCM